MFDVDLTNLQQCKVNEASAGIVVKRDSQMKAEEVIAQNMRLNAFRKFVRFCEFFNLDPLHSQCLAFALVLASKLSNKSAIIETLVSKFSFCSNIDNLQNIECGQELMSVMSDWCTILSFVTISTKQFSDTIANTAMAQAMQDGKLICPPDKFLELACLSVLYVSVANVSTSHMLQRLFQRFDIADRDLEYKSLKIANFYNDKNVSAVHQAEFFIILTDNLSVSPGFFDILRSVLQDLDSPVKQVKSKPQRPNLRKLVQEIHKNTKAESAESFQTWASTLRFSVTTSTQLQRLLYFIHVQSVKPSLQTYSHLFSIDTLNRVNSKQADTIDKHAVSTVINSLRIYQHNIKHMVDFRQICLTGLSVTQRQALSAVSIARLYVCIFQHDSIWEWCWKTVLPILNQTIVTTRNSFIKKYDFEIDAVVASLIWCHVKTDA